MDMSISVFDDTDTGTHEIVFHCRNTDFITGNDATREYNRVSIAHVDPGVPARRNAR